MPSLSTQQQIEELLLDYIQNEDVSPEDADAARRDLMRYADAAERGDAEATMALRELGIEVGAATTGGGGAQTAAGRVAQATTGGGEDWRTQIPVFGGAFAPGGWFGPSATTTTTTTGAGGAGTGGEDIAPPWAPEVYTDPDSGRRFTVETNYGIKTLGKEITGDASATGVEAKMAQLVAYEAKYGQLSDSDRQRFLLGFAPSGGAGGGGMTAYQAAQLEQQRFENALAAARTAQPLSYLAAIRGAVPGAGGTDLYQGIRPVVPTVGAGLTAPTMGATSAAYRQRLVACQRQAARHGKRQRNRPFMSTLQSGGRLGAATVPAGTIRIPGPQQQSEMTPYETGAYEETANYQGIPSMDWQNWLAKSRQAVGSGLSLARYGGRLR